LSRHVREDLFAIVSRIVFIGLVGQAVLSEVKVKFVFIFDGDAAWEEGYVMWFWDYFSCTSLKASLQCTVSMFITK
jgi:hypothetical protein